jgi:hypothetical protein
VQHTKTGENLSNDLNIYKMAIQYTKRGHCMCKELPVIPVNRVVDPKRIIGKKWRAKEEERHNGVAGPKRGGRF